MAAGVTDRLWDVLDLPVLLDEREAVIANRRRGSYKKQAALISGNV